MTSVTDPPIWVPLISQAGGEPDGPHRKNLTLPAGVGLPLTVTESVTDPPSVIVLALAWVVIVGVSKIAPTFAERSLLPRPLPSNATKCS